MSETLVVQETLQRTGWTVIDDKKVVQHSCTLPLNNPKAMRVSMTKLDPDLYREHADICRADFAEFEDAAFELQKKYSE